MDERRRFVQLILPYLKREDDKKLTCWYIDEAGFNLEGGPSYGYSEIGKNAISLRPIKSKNTTLLLAIAKNKRSYFQLFEGGITAEDFLGFMISLI